ncbi:alkaline phosphatase isozyme conversion aminopeptidase [Pseudobythopirellula maris]|uniref:Alkaline phosphatase isozyme conversion aminopeptidase n=1 Tax=Pseudobythopirellula maris TaxID=2527991 RepID=A0A5C5ZPJ8_9BACT|nr:M28 family peptidase [Pseudobythopirellula maris]TWT89045.1 alkaline phosphatase isozyme conversion aminopeptidase [Pseudobythopirellula maris]
MGERTNLDSRRPWAACALAALFAILTPLVATAEEPANPIDANPIDGARAFGYLEALCEFGPRPSGSEAMLAQRDYVVEHFESLGAEVELQKFRAKNPLFGRQDGQLRQVRMANVVARYQPEKKERVLLCAHYDTRPLPSMDPNPRVRATGRFIGANDGASGTALLMELAHHLEEYDGPMGVDLVLFDGEELVYIDPTTPWGKGDPYFLGSNWFAQQYKRRKDNSWDYRWGVLLDMVGDKDLQIYQEVHSFRWKSTRPLVQEIWGTAARLGVEEFVPRTKHLVKDDHLPLNQIGKIPTIDLIDFDYPHWHTEADTPRQCSGESLAKVGWVVWEWLGELRPAPAE